MQPPSTAGSGVPVPASPGWHNAIDGLDRWDAGWFERIARSGYDATDASAAFFPGYPLAIRAVSYATGLGSFGSASFVSAFAFLGSLIVLFALTTREFSRVMARRTVLLACFFPSSFFFFAPYSESLFLLASALTFWWARGKRPWLAGAAGFAAAGTRSVGVLLVPALVVEAMAQPGRRRWQAVAASFVPMMAPILYGVYWFVRAGDALRPFHAQDTWHRTLVVPLVSLGNALWLGITGSTDARGIYWTADLVLVAALLLPFALRWRVIPIPYRVYTLATLLVVLSYPLPARPLLSVPRFLIVLFPLVWSLADLVDDRRRFSIALVASMAGYAVLAAAFMDWGFIF